VRIVVTDVAYRDDVACAAAVVADRWEAQFPLETHTALRTPVAPYVPGEFWQRELPCLEAVLDGLRPDVVAVDGYVWLDDVGRRGLGAHLHDRVGVPVVGIAKTAFQGSAHAKAVVRGGSARPLYVTAVGLDPQDAADAVARMHGPHRLPTLVVLADHLARGGQA
jgi:deoxyribonuclease V